MTLLRDPCAMALSYARFFWRNTTWPPLDGNWVDRFPANVQSRMLWDGFSEATFARRAGTGNLSRMVANLLSANMDVVGITERMDETMLLAMSKLGWPLAQWRGGFGWSNAAKGKRVTKRAMPGLQACESKMAGDRAMHAHFDQQLSRAVADQGVLFQRDLSLLSQHKGKRMYE